MKLAPARIAAFGALLAVERGGWSAESLRAKSAHLDVRDAGLASEIAFGTLRRKGELDRVIEHFAQRKVDSLDTEVVIALEMALYQIRHLERVPPHAAVNDSVELVKRAGMQSAAPFTNAILRRSLAKKWTSQWKRPRPNGCWRAGRGNTAHHSPAPSHRRACRPPSPTSAWALARLHRTVPSPLRSQAAIGLPIADSGAFRFQDISSQAVVPLLDLQPGQTFLDVCGAPGNKTAQALETELRAFTCDLHLSRAKTLLPLQIPVTVLDATKPLPFAARFDRILVDAPCSGTGTLARNPEIKWKLRYNDVAELQDRQTAILRNALDLLAPGGLLVYSTCSLERDENEDVVAGVKANLIRTMQRIPGRDQGDGFFAAVLQRP